MKTNVEVLVKKWGEILKVDQSLKLEIVEIENNSEIYSGEVKVDFDDKTAVIKIKTKDLNSLVLDEILISSLIRIKMAGLKEFTNDLIEKVNKTSYDRFMSKEKYDVIETAVINDLTNVILNLYSHQYHDILKGLIRNKTPEEILDEFDYFNPENIE